MEDKTKFDYEGFAARLRAFLRNEGVQLEASDGGMGVNNAVLRAWPLTDGEDPLGENIESRLPAERWQTGECRLALDTERQVFFYEPEHYYLSNFSAFEVVYRGFRYPTAEHAYHAQKFSVESSLRSKIRYCPSAHVALQYAREHKHLVRGDWDEVKVAVMRDVLAAKVHQHDYVRVKLLETGNKELVENSWRDDFWGWGPQRDGQNWMGKLWMEVRANMRAQGVTK